MIRSARPDDAAIIREFDIFAGDRGGDIINGRVFVCEIDRKVGGYISVASYRFHGYLYIQFLCIHKEFRRRGIASVLIAHVESQHANTRLFISTESTNTAMLCLLRTHGYCISGALSGLNRDGSQEVFFFKDISLEQARTGK